MNKSFLKKGLIAILLVLVFVFAAVGCGGNNDDIDLIDKSALNEEIALEIVEQGDYTEQSYDAYMTILGEAKAVANDENATKAEVDEALSALKEARLALTTRPILEVSGADKAITLNSKAKKEITLADYINTSDLSKITYEVKTNNEIVTLSEPRDGKFTITAGEVSEKTVLTVSVIVYYDGAEGLKVDLSVRITTENTESNPDYAPDDNIIKDW